MKKLISLLLILVFILSGCQSTEQTVPAEPVGDCSFSMQDIYPGESMVISLYPQIFGDKIVFSSVSNPDLFVSNPNKLYIHDINSGEEISFDTSIYAAYLSGDYLYGNKSRELIKMNIQTGEEEILFSAPKSKPFGVSNGGSGRYFVFWVSGDNYKDAEFYFYDTKKEKYTSFFEGNILDPNHDFKVKNDFVAFVQKEDDGEYTFYGVYLPENKSTVLHKTETVPYQYLYNGNFLLWSDKNGIHYLKDGAVSDIENESDDLDIYGNRYVFFSHYRQIYIYDIETSQTVFTTDEGYGEKDFNYPYYSTLFALDEESGKTCFIKWNDESALSYYGSWEHGGYPELISVIDIKELS